MNQISFDELFIQEKTSSPKPSAPSQLERDIQVILEHGETSALNICEKLIAINSISSDRYLTEKPKDYYKVCCILDSLHNEGKLRFIEDKDKTDRIYELIL
ncbi:MULTISPECIES: DUF3895 domain-containing protein [Metabacillus]|uniref:DUF3895 domain-containing protein n=1 Tax=Metabacillus TaxID=2675233 RepID=UPI000C7FA348|nr:MULTISPECIES: DUF3895 domain-containing protein [Metabacillus]MCM3443271.1 DUF3895 domain-containing protein [Metabacillus halosaccharovorans]PMC34215.1 hypothetical protein CJ195_24155 [Bacillus sp. UMB0899]